MKPYKDLTKNLAKAMKKQILDLDPGNDARLIRVLGELKMGFAFLETFKHDHVVTIFGSARTKKNDIYYRKARELAKKLGSSGMTILTGGGPGIMEAANRGAVEAGTRSLGINIYLNSGERRNTYVKEGIGCYYFFNRKVLLAYAAQAYVFFPGGYGTLDELFEILTLIATKKIEKKLPVVLIGKEFWNPLTEWLKKEPIRDHATLTEKELKIYHVLDDIDEAFRIIQGAKKKTKAERHDAI